MGSESARADRVRHEQEFFADWVVNAEGDALRWRRELDLLRRAKPGGLGSVLSLGCGRGWFETLVAEDAERVVGVDLSPESIADAKALAERDDIENVDFICADVTGFELDQSFDTVICVGFLHHLSDADGIALLSRIRKHMRPGGLLHTQDPNVHGLLRKVGRVLLGDRYDQFHSEDERELDPLIVQAMFLEAGFEQASIRYMDLSLIPAMQLFPSAPRALMSVCAAIDRAWCALPVARWASGFTVDAIR